MEYPEVSNSSLYGVIKSGPTRRNQMIKKEELLGLESNNEFLHVSTLNIYKELVKKNLNIK